VADEWSKRANRNYRKRRQEKFIEQDEDYLDEIEEWQRDARK